MEHLLAIGLAMLAGLLLTRLTKRFNLPDVTSYLIAGLLVGPLALGAFHVQFNCISSDVLRDAQLHPENYKDLLVRVAGYSTQFVNLSKSMQDAIIARTEHAAF